jgi:hypothetical protein
MASEKIIVTEVKNKVIVKSPGPQGPAGRTILNGTTAPSNNLGVIGDFYYNTVTTDFYGPKMTDLSWSNATVIKLVQEGSEYSYSTSWELAQVTGPVNGVYSVVINHNLEFFPNVTIKSSSGDIVETGINYNSTNQITLTMAQPFSGTAYLS